ncbi:MAG: L,D-transpeptidase family protein [Lachnospiraceae bacterium]|nr:L,D-transpeptidase family protein [Lachnospiraceae bacterium]
MKITRIKNAGISVFLAAVLFAASGPAVWTAEAAESANAAAGAEEDSSAAAETAAAASTTSGSAVKTADTAEAADTTAEAASEMAETTEAADITSGAAAETAETTAAAESTEASEEAMEASSEAANALAESAAQASEAAEALSEATAQAIETAEALAELTAQAAEAAEALANSEAQVTAAAEAIVESEAQAAEAEAALAAELSLAAGSEPADISSGLYEITNVTSDDFVLDAKTCTVLDTDYHSLQLYDRLDINQQKFYLEELPGSTWRLSVLSSGEAVTFTFTNGSSDSSSGSSAGSSSDSSSGSGSSGNTAVSVTGSAALSELIKDAGASARASQSFTLTDAGDGSYYIQTSDGSYLTLDDSFAHRGSSVVLQEYTGRANQRWKLTKTWASETDSADTDLSNPFAEGGIYEDFLLTIKTDAMRDYLTAETVSSWISISEEEHTLIYDEEALTAWVQALSDVRSTLENGREFTTSLGETITVTAGTYGWSMDVASTASRLLSKIKSGESGSMEAVWSTRGYEYNSQNDISDTYVEVDLTNQKVWLYVGGELLYESDCVSGTYDDPDRHTPEGVYTIYYMASPATLHGADYTSEVQYWMAYYGNFGLHDANWRSEFGGDIYLTDGSHGCVNLPDDMAQIIYENAYIGMLVVTYY